MQKQSPDRSRFQQLQYEFAAHIRDPQAVKVPAEIEPRRMKIYSELFYNNVEGLLATNFPVLKQISTDEYWHGLVRGFFADHRCQTPYFLQVAEEFMAYIAQEREPQSDDPAFLQELLHYEWVELALEVSEQTLPLDDVEANGDLLAGHPVQSPLAWLLSYQYPVHRISPDFLPDTPSDVANFLLVYRNRDDRVKFMEINPVTGRLLYLLAEDDSLSGRQVLEQVAAEMQHPQPEVVIQGGLDTLEQLRAKGILLGTRC